LFKVVQKTVRHVNYLAKVCRLMILVDPQWALHTAHKRKDHQCNSQGYFGLGHEGMFTKVIKSNFRITSQGCGFHCVQSAKQWAVGVCQIQNLFSKGVENVRKKLFYCLPVYILNT